MLLSIFCTPFSKHRRNNSSVPNIAYCLWQHEHDDANLFRSRSHLLKFCPFCYVFCCSDKASDIIIWGLNKCSTEHSLNKDKRKFWSRSLIHTCTVSLMTDFVVNIHVYTYIKIIHDLRHILSRHRNTNVKGLLLIGSGRFFSNGIDLTWLSQQTGDDPIRFIDALHRLLYRVTLFPIPTAALINGTLYLHVCLFDFFSSVKCRFL